MRCCPSPTSAGSSTSPAAWPSSGVEIVSTGGTARELAAAGLEVRGIEDFTGFPEIMDGRVKTLHPKLYAGLLGRRDDPEHLRQAAEHGIEFVDLVCVNLYPFERTAGRRGASDDEVIENIDIGGPAMIRAAAKNHAFAAVVVRPESYDAVLEELREGDGLLSLPTREWLAAEAFSYTARYDTAISRWFAREVRGLPAASPRAPSRRSPTCPTARTRTSAPPTTPRSARARTCSRRSPAPRQAALVQQPPRPRRGAALLRDLERARVRDRQAQQPVRRRRRRDRRSSAYRPRSRATR